VACEYMDGWQVTSVVADLDKTLGTHIHTHSQEEKAGHGKRTPLTVPLCRCVDGVCGVCRCV
jgi:hypothetical protein